MPFIWNLKTRSASSSNNSSSSNHHCGIVFRRESCGARFAATVTPISAQCLLPVGQPHAFADNVDTVRHALGPSYILYHETSSSLGASERAVQLTQPTPNLTNGVSTIARILHGFLGAVSTNKRQPNQLLGWRAGQTDACAAVVVSWTWSTIERRRRWAGRGSFLQSVSECASRLMIIHRFTESEPSNYIGRM